MQLPPPPSPLTQGQRTIVFFVNAAAAWLIFRLATGESVPAGSGASVWFLALIAHWLLTLLDAPFFLPPRDALGMAIGTVLLVAPIDLSTAVFKDALGLTVRTTLAFSLLVAVLSAYAVFRISTVSGGIAYRLSGVLGRSELLLSPAVAVSAIGFYPQQPGWTACILILWVVATVVRPLERLVNVVSVIWRPGSSTHAGARVGALLRVDDPDVVRVSLRAPATTWKPGVAHAVRIPNGEMRLVLPLFVQIQNDGLIGTGLCCSAEIPAMVTNLVVGQVHSVDDPSLGSRLLAALSDDACVEVIAGVVVEGSSIGELRFQIVDDAMLEEGTVIYAIVRSQKVYYQILDAETNEESFLQQPLGAHIGRAAQLGTFESETGFRKFPWLPEMNRPLFAIAPSDVSPRPPTSGSVAVGMVPNTQFAVTAQLNDLIEYHTAILGATGTGKTELTLDIIRSAIKDGCKVVCVDLTGEYKTRLADCGPRKLELDLHDSATLAALLFDVETGSYGAPAEKKALKSFLEALQPRVETAIDEFLAENAANLATIELPEITNTKATLRATELYLSAIMNWARKHRRARRVLVVLEEAHTIIPEAFASGFDPETQWVVGRIGQIALQGRKYGVGLLLVSQRTALVSKTVLSQCNTFFIHSLVDKTSLDFLGGVVGPEHLRSLPNLRFLDFIAHGKAVNSERPLLVRRAYDEQKRDQDQALSVGISSGGSVSPT